MAVLLFAILIILMRRSFRLTDGIIQPVTEMRNKVKKSDGEITVFKLSIQPLAERITLYYELGYGMQIFSREGEKIKVEIRLGKNIQPKS